MLDDLCVWGPSDPSIQKAHEFALGILHRRTHEKFSVFWTEILNFRRGEFLSFTFCLFSSGKASGLLCTFDQRIAISDQSYLPRKQHIHQKGNGLHTYKRHDLCQELQTQKIEAEFYLYFSGSMDFGTSAFFSGGSEDLRSSFCS